MASMIDHAVLALVIERPSYGYELYERFDRRFGEFLSASQGTVYEALKRLERDGYVEVAGAGGSRGRPRINHRATAEGVAASRSWIRESLWDDPRRLELFSRLASLGLRNPGMLLEVIDGYEGECAREARQIEMPPPGGEQGVSDPMGELLWELFVERRRRIAAAELEWVPVARSKVREWAARWALGEGAQ